MLGVNTEVCLAHYNIGTGEMGSTLMEHGWNHWNTVAFNFGSSAHTLMKKSRFNFSEKMVLMHKSKKSQFSCRGLNKY